MIYAAASPSLAVLEVMVHLDLPPEMIPDDYRLLSIEIPDDAPREVVTATPATALERRARGDDFLTRSEALVLSVSSVIVPQERNSLINPRHAAAARLVLVSDAPFRLDPRLLGSGRD